MPKLLQSSWKPRYSSLPEVDEESIKEEEGLHQQQQQTRITHGWLHQWHWMLLCAFLLCLNALQYARSLRSFEKGFTTDFGQFSHHHQ